MMNTKTRNYCVLFKCQPPFIVTVWKRATRTFFNISLFAFHWRTKNMKMSEFFGWKNYFKSSCHAFMLKKMIVFICDMALMKRGQAFQPMNSHSYEKLKSGGWMGSPKHKIQHQQKYLIWRGQREILHESRLVEGWRLSCQNVSKKWKRINTSEWIFHNTS